jgi:hypothetical protein
MALFGERQVNYSSLLFITPFWAVGFGVLAWSISYLFSTTVYTSFTDRLHIERSFAGYRRLRDIPRHGIQTVRQIEDGVERESSFPSWALVIEGQSNVMLLSKQSMEASDWFGPIEAAWVGVKYEPWRDATTYEHK